MGITSKICKTILKNIYKYLIIKLYLYLFLLKDNITLLNQVI